MANKIKVTHIQTVMVTDPDSKGVVEVLIVKMETGGMVGIDASFLENTEEKVYSPYDKSVELDVSEL